ncbi:thiosulfohydrolase SoxB [Methylobacter sp. YRD-M1]|uniref:thiosulfohydrolase SoxB n=1 Tax=Methylobacter sp. YRD-M1 TaxID=2911520 RepID=UPI00227BAB39|nr:thiosulfohydrolase SoxB [Methylobacter sp. YRD-M1]WAK02945.1 thiosulfohydrolase SoxB [Methylobacter sp. YRD-M1]
MNRRHFLQCLALLGLSGCAGRPAELYDLPEFGNATLLHFTDCHAQLLPIYFREPAVNIGVGENRNKPPHLTGQQFLDFYGIKPGSAEAYAFTHLDFVEMAHVYGKMGGFAHLATLIKQIRQARGHENTLLLDGGDSWQGSATALWTKGRDMVEASNLLGVDIMTGHWEFTYGSRQVLDNIARFRGEFIAQNIALTEEAQFAGDAETDAVFKPYVIKAFRQGRVAVIGQAFPYTPIANPKRFTPDWQFGIHEQKLQRTVNQIKAANEADVIVLLSHNGMPVDLKLASRVSGLDVILGGHTHDALPKPIPVRNAGGTTWVTNAGSHGKFLAVLDLDIQPGRLKDLRYRLLPVFSNLLEPDKDMQVLIDVIRRPYLEQLQRPLAVTGELLYRRDTFCGTFDQLILDALLAVNDAQIALSPGFRWGTSLLPGQTITFEDVMSQTAITYPETYVRTLTGRELKAILEDVADNLFNKDPYYQQGGDMVRVGGMSFACDPEAEFGRRISRMRLSNGDACGADRSYKVTGWASVGQVDTGRSVWDVVADYLLDRKMVGV